MINIANLKTEHIGRFVRYSGVAGEREDGRLKSWNDRFIFVVYKCNNEWHRFQEFTGVATNPENLEFIDSKVSQ